MTSTLGSTKGYLEDEIATLNREIAEYVADGDRLSVIDAKAYLGDLEWELAELVGDIEKIAALVKATEGDISNQGIHSGDKRYRA